MDRVPWDIDVSSKPLSTSVARLPQRQTEHSVFVRLRFELLVPSSTLDCSGKMSQSGAAVGGLCEGVLPLHARGMADLHPTGFAISQQLILILAAGIEVR